MKCSQQINALVVGLVLTSFPGALGQTYGPDGCVSISRSREGTCVIATNCGEGIDLDKLEFAFDCQAGAEVQKHSFGVGGFDMVEEFDTGIKCGQCMLPQNHKVHKVVKKSAVHMVARQIATQEDALVDKYGPGNCVESWRSTTGTCMIRTKCKSQDISKYDFGLLCVHNVTSGENVRHLFGQNSFDPEEEFDTLIKCEKCLGLRAEATKAAAVGANVKSEDLVKKVNALVDEVGAMQTGLEKIQDDVKVLNEKVPKLYTGEAKKEEEGEAKDEAKEGEAKEGEAKEGEAKEKAEEKKAELFLSHHRSARHSHQKHHQKHHQKQHGKQRHKSDEDEDDDEDKAEDEGSDDSSSSKSGDKEQKDQDDEQDEDDRKVKNPEDWDDKQVDDDSEDSENAN